MTINNMFILFKKTDFNPIFSLLGVRCIGGGGCKIFIAKIGGRNLFDVDFL